MPNTELTGRGGRCSPARRVSPSIVRVEGRRVELLDAGERGERRRGDGLFRLGHNTIEKFKSQLTFQLNINNT